jgi:hypothetical protein
MCGFCKKEYKKLSRHMETVHKDTLEVSEILKLDKHLRRKQFALLRNRGTLEKNKNNPKELEPIKVSNKSDNTSVNIVHCSNCKGSYHRSYF